MEAREGAVRAAREILVSLSLDDDTDKYLRQGLDDAVDQEEIRDLLAPYLPSDELDRIFRVQASASVNSSRNDDARRDNIVVSTQNQQSESMSVAAEDVAGHSMVVRTQETRETHETRETREKRTSAPRRTVQPKAKRVGANEIDETSCSDDAEEAGQVLAATNVLNARAVKAGHYVMIGSHSHPCRVQKLMGTQKAYKGPASGCFKTRFEARCIFTGKKVEHLCLATDDVRIASVQNLECTVMYIGDAGELSLLTTAGVEKCDVNLPTETDEDRKLAERIKRDFQKGKTIVVRVMSSCGVEKVVEVIEHKCTG